MSQNITDFISNFRGGARPNRFRVTFTYPAAVGSPNVRDSIVIKAAQLPESTTGVIQVPYMGRQIPVPGDRTFQDWNITVVNDTTFSHRNLFERWSNLINGHESNLQGASSYKDLLATVDIVQLDRDDRVLKTIKLYNMFPTTIGAIELGYDQQDTIEEFTVTLSYSHWASVNTPTS